MILNGYGGFAIAETPVWSPQIAAWCAAGGAFAIAGLRGGFEHGEAWHHAGRRGQQAERVRRLPRRRRLAGRRPASPSRERLAVARRLERRAAGRRRADAAARPVPGRVVRACRCSTWSASRSSSSPGCGPTSTATPTWPRSSPGCTPTRRTTTSPTATCYPAVLFTTAEGDTRVDPLHARKMAALAAGGVDGARTSGRSCCSRRAGPATASASRSPSAPTSWPTCWRSWPGSSACSVPAVTGRAEWLVVGGPAEPWERLGLTVVDGTVPLFGTGLRIDPDAAARHRPAGRCRASTADVRRHRRAADRRSSRRPPRRSSSTRSAPSGSTTSS